MSFLVCYDGSPVFVGSMEQVEIFIEDEVDCGLVRKHVTVYALE